MKRFFGKLALFVSILSVITVGVNVLYRSILNEKDSNDTVKFDDIPEQIQICNLGSSHGRDSFNYNMLSDVGYTCFNFALGAQLFSYDYRVLEYYQNKLTDGCIVFIPVSYFSLFGIEETAQSSFPSRNKRYYEFLPAAYIKEYDLKTRLFVKFGPALTEYEMLPYNIIHFFFLDGWEDVRDRTTSELKIQGMVDRRIEEHCVTERLDENGNRIFNQEEIAALYEIITLCRNLNAVPVLITTPYLSEYTDGIAASHPDLYDDFYGIMERVVADTGVAYYDYARDARFASDYSLFMDADHLNRTGAEKFTGILMEEVVAKMAGNPWREHPQNWTNRE